MDSKLVSSVDNALTVLLLFKSRKVLRVADVAGHLGVARSTAHRLLVSLTQRGFAAQEPITRAYIPGPELTEIGLAVVDMLDIRGRARPYMTALAQELQETVSLVVLEGANIRFLDSIESPQILRVGSRTGQILPAHCVSGGKALLSTLSRDTIDGLYPVEELPALTPRSIGTKTALLQALDVIREHGYATNQEESEPDVTAVAVTLQTADSLSAITVAAPTSRVDSVDALGATVQRIIEDTRSKKEPTTL
ncbi:IclR family transcriptional regulator [Streptomyces hokutonensis]|uniref:IclR family transcriptional regulator n=1 Tax=Streptomyces hokutonensis TaxID=1306990 RepID=UPI00382189C5